MNNRLLLSLILGTGVLTAFSDTPKSLSIDFSYGMPEGVEVYDLDGCSPSPDLPKDCFIGGASWTAYNFGGSDGRVAVSTSWYTPAGQADDWMILPQIHVEDGAELRWTSRAWDRYLPDGYSVYVSTKGTEPADFDRTAPLYTTKAESHEWTAHTLNLDAYAGETVSIAFVNDSYDCSMLLISDIFAGTPQTLDFSLDADGIGAPGESMPLRLRVSTQISGELRGLRAGYSHGDRSGSLELTDLVLTADTPAVVEIPYADITYGNDPAILEVWMECGDTRVEKSLTIGSYPRRMVVEEATGTWCMWCVGGMVMMENMKERYPDNFIGIAVHSGDPMAVDGYQLNVSSYPQVHINRQYKGVSISDVESHMPSIMESVPDGIISGNYDITDGIVTVRTQTLTKSLHTTQDYTIAVVVTENDVHVPNDPGYFQKNAYADGSNGEMGGFEDKPAIIPAAEMWYQDVARCILADERGIPGSIPAIMNPGEPSVFNYSFALPETVLDPDNIEVILLLIERNGQRILNGAKAVRNGQSGVEEISEADAGTVLRTDYFDLQGRRIAAPAQGITIKAEHLSDGSVRTSKIIR